ncbi:MAG: MFS transporter, partial [Gaiellaceae bacterium]
TGVLAAAVAPVTVVWIGSLVLAAAGLTVSVTSVRETAAHVQLEQRGHAGVGRGSAVIAAASQAGFVNNLNDALAWGLVPLYLAAHGRSAAEIGVVAAVYPAVWGFGQLAAGALSDRVGREPLIVAGMLVQGAALALLAAAGGGLGGSLVAAVLLGAGTALVYPVLLAAVSDAVAPVDRARAVGAYRFWRDAGLVAGALLAGAGSDSLGSGSTILVVAALTALSGLGYRLLAGEGRRMWQLT